MDLINKSQLLAYKLTGPGIEVKDAAASVTLAEKLITNVIGFLTLIGFIFFVIQVILAGYLFMSSEGDKGKMETARKKLTDGLLGIIVIVVALGLVSLFASVLGIDKVFDLNNFFNNTIK
jgi:purine-cytosine permease-like protein